MNGLRFRGRSGWREGPEAMQVVSGIAGDVVHFEAPPSSRVGAEMQAFLKWWEGDSRQLNGLVRAAVAHFRFVTIHPFDDGNGRIARALSDMALAQNDGFSKRYFSMSQQIERNRLAYYNLLETNQRGDGDLTAWIEWFLSMLADALRGTVDAVNTVRARTRFWDAHRDTELNGRQRKVIVKMLDHGPEAFVGGLTNRKYVAIASTSKPTATRDLADLVDKGVLRIGNAAGRSTYYELIWLE